MVCIMLQGCVRSLVLGTLKKSQNVKTPLFCSFMFWRPPVFEASTHNLLHVDISIAGPRYGASAFCTVGSKALIFMMSCSASNKGWKGYKYQEGTKEFLCIVTSRCENCDSRWKLQSLIAPLKSLLWLTMRGLLYGPSDCQHQQCQCRLCVDAHSSTLFHHKTCNSHSVPWNRPISGLQFVASSNA